MQNPTKPCEGRRWMRAGEFAERVGMSHRAVRDWCAFKRIPARRRGLKLWFVDLFELRVADDPDVRKLYEAAMMSLVAENEDLAMSA